MIGTQCAARPLCSATVFEDTNDGCIEQSWLWDGGQCSPVEHCGCAGGDCDRLYADEAGCQTAHAACVPAGCESQDARSGALMCGTIEGYSFRGWQCEAVLCQCSGSECAEIAATPEECESRYGHCMDRPLPACVDPVFPVVSTDPGYDPNYPAFDFSVEGYDELIDSETGEASVFGEWTPAEWLGWEAGADPEFCIPVAPGRFTLSCPSTRPLLLQVGDEVMQVNITLHWDGLAQETVTPTNVEVRISEHASGSLALEIRDATDQAPIVVLVKAENGRTGTNAPWTFGPFTLNAGAARCMTSPDVCNWTFSALDLDVSAGDAAFTLPPLGSKRVVVDGNDFAVVYGYILEQSTVTDDACDSGKSWHQNFALLRIPAEE